MGTQVHKIRQARTAILLLVAFLLAVFSSVIQAQPTDRDANLRSRALQLRSAGDFRGSLNLLTQLSERQPTAANFSALLDLQGLLKDPEGVDQTISRLTPLIQGWPDHIRSRDDLRLATSVAEAMYQTNRHQEADSLWELLKKQANNEQLAQELFSSYRRVRRYDHAENYAIEVRGKFSQPDLWALNLASMYEEQGFCQKSFDEYKLYLDKGKSSATLVARRLLILAEKCRDDEAFFEHMYKCALAEGRGVKPPVLPLQVMEVLVQTGHFRLSIELAWALDSGDGAIPFSLAKTLVADHRGDLALLILDRLRERKDAVSQAQDFAFQRAQSLALCNRPEEAISAYQEVIEQGGPLRWTAGLEAARLLHRPLLRPEEAAAQLDDMLRQAGQTEAQLLQIRLLGGLERYQEARELRQGASSRARGEAQAELEFLQVELALWQGNLKEARLALPGFLQSRSQHALFNDAIELMDLLAFAATDSQTVVLAGKARRLAWLGQTRAALDVYHEASASGGPAAEWLDWQAVELACRELPPEEAMLVVDMYATRHSDSIRLDRLAWYRIDLMEAQHYPVRDVLAACEEMLREWPDSILQDQIRRRIRKLEENGID